MGILDDILGGLSFVYGICLLIVGLFFLVGGSGLVWWVAVLCSLLAFLVAFGLIVYAKSVMDSH